MIEDFTAYIEGKYMPPIQIKPILKSTPSKKYGTHFGIFATAKIQPFVLIG
jgi:hypothetical protein